MLIEEVLLKKRFAKTSLTDYPDQEAYANLPEDVEGDFQPFLLGQNDQIGSNTFNVFLTAVPTTIVDRGTETPASSGNWRATKLKFHN